MLYFALPNFYENFAVNAFMRDLNKQRPEVFKTKVSFYAQTGSIPYCSWTGGLNSNVGPGAYYNDLIELQRNSNLPLRINMANVMLEESDYYDNFADVILKIFDCGSNVIELSSIPLMEFISEKYPEYRFTFSKNADLITEFTPELLGSIMEIDSFLSVGIPEKYSFNKEWLKQLPKKSKCEITVNPKCGHCKDCDICLLKEHQNQISYSGNRGVDICEKAGNIFDASHIISIEEIEKTYHKMGFTKFTFSPSYAYDNNTMVKFYLGYFVKPEYHMELYATWEQEMEKMKRYQEQQMK